MIPHVNTMPRCHCKQIVNAPVTGIIPHPFKCFVGCCHVAIVSHITLLSSSFVLNLPLPYLSGNARPELTETVTDMSSYGVIYLGYPNWWGTMSMAVFTFLESYDFSGKTIVPYCTHEGSGLGSSERDIKKLCPTAKALSGLAIKGGTVARTDNDVANWLKKLGLLS